MNEEELVSCTHKDSLLTVLGKGNVYVKTKDGSNLKANDVLYSENLSYNLLSIKQFVDKGLSTYLDNKIIDIYDPKHRESLLTGVYKNPS